ncbi:tripartite tricarboxylate transporter substrate binding protein [Rhodoplanes roseus]|uniref:LacI family transcriptional regulator n=1 Tax=Rhodoplanes roseus TaxID=29409 RepID=A0A327KXR3_9BRAD|nr:tripartite tricarboxylate transporter substrate binding protein [Rhodoplanes roseus]RAI43051.1 hypothetical protein CH341_16275 [Rhodoplanes roseus]
MNGPASLARSVSRRTVLRAAASTAVVATAGLPAWAPARAQAPSDYPGRAVKLLVPSAPGGGTDITARLLANELQKLLGQSFYVENRSGAGQMIGISAVAQSPPDGYTLLMAASTLAINPAMYKTVSYDAVRDFSPVSLVVSLPNVLVVNAALPVKTVQELVALAKQKPGQLTYASAGIGTSPHMSMELFKSMSGTDILHVPYKGTTPGLNDLVAGTVNAMMVNALSVKSHVEAGSLRALGVTSLTRLKSMPDVPAIADAGVPGYEAIQWYGLLAPAKTPDAIVRKLHAAVVEALKDETIKERIALDGAEPVGSTPDAFATQIAGDLDKWAKAAKAAGIEPK